MEYNLAEELKDAGFPQSLLPTCVPDGWFDTEHTFEETKEVAVYEPTLEELIEACGERIAFRLQWVGGKWLANNKEKLGIGVTLIEAVARLWLALNKI